TALSPLSLHDALPIWAATSSGANSSDLLGCTSWPNSFGSPPVGSLTGYIQFVVGIWSWKPGEIMKARNFSARSLSGEPAMRPARSEEHTSELQSLTNL